MSQYPDSAKSASPLVRLRRWLDGFARRATANHDGQARINGRQIYILPTRFGLLFAVMLMAMLLGANNYGSNPGFLFTFLLAGLAMAALLQTWKNLLGLRVRALSPEPVYLGQPIQFPVRLSAEGNNPRGGLLPGARHDKRRHEHSLDIGVDEWKTGFISGRGKRRGWQSPPTLVISSVFPLGLFRAWAYVELDQHCLVYPKPAETGSGHDYQSSASDQPSLVADQGEDFSGHRPYQVGDNMHHVDWKVVARGQGWHTKRFEAEGGDQRWLRLTKASGNDVEQRLSSLTRAVIELAQSSAIYGLDLGETVVDPDTGPGHRDRCLKALALFGGS